MTLEMWLCYDLNHNKWEHMRYESRDRGVKWHKIVGRTCNERCKVYELEVVLPTHVAD